MIIGQEKLQAFFEAAIAEGNLGSTYVLTGPAQVGKRTLARYIAALVLKSSEEKLATNPDFSIFERAVDEKTEKVRKDITVAQARVIRGHLMQSAWSGGYRVVVIDEAEHLNTEAGNALLKILEEPPKKSLIFLLTEDESALLPTIRSRAQVLQCSLSADATIEAWLVSQGCEKTIVREITSLAWGRPGRAKQLVQDTEFLQTCREAVANWQAFRREPVYKQSNILEKMLTALEKDSNSRDAIKKILEVWRMEERRMLRSAPTQTHVRVIDRLGQGQSLLEQNINPRLLLETLLFQI